MFETRMKNLFYGDRHLPITTYLVNKYLNNYSEPRVTIKVPYYPSSLITSLQTNHENKFRRVNRTVSEAQNLKRVYNINGQNPTQYSWFEEEKKVNENQDQNHKSQKIHDAKNQEKQICDWRKFKRLM